VQDEDAGDRATNSRHTPRRRGIQYAAVYRFNHNDLWNPGSPGPSCPVLPLALRLRAIKQRSKPWTPIRPEDRRRTQVVCCRQAGRL